MNDICSASKLVTPTPEIINQVKKDYNKVLKRFEQADKFLNSLDPLDTKKDLYATQYRVEVVDVLNTYYQVLRDWGVEITQDETLQGFKV